MSEDKGLDLHFPGAGHRIPLTRGTAVVFDTAQPQAVIERGATGFRAADFGPARDCTLLSLTRELPIENPQIAQTLGVNFDIDPANALRLNVEQVWLNGARVSVCPESGNSCQDFLDGIETAGSRMADFAGQDGLQVTGAPSFYRQMKVSIFDTF